MNEHTDCDKCLSINEREEIFALKIGYLKHHSDEFKKHNSEMIWAHSEGKHKLVHDLIGKQLHCAWALVNFIDNELDNNKSIEK